MPTRAVSMGVRFATAVLAGMASVAGCGAGVAFAVGVSAASAAGELAAAAEDPAAASAAADEPTASAPPAAGDAAAWRSVVSKFAEEHFHNPAWGYSHCRRDYELARELAAADHVKLDDDVLYAAAYLHDMAAFEPWEKSGVDHADRAAELVDSILKNTGFPMKKIDAVRGAIRTHMYDRNPVGPEALYLHDADALDWLGAIGVARIFGLVDPKGGNPTGPEVVPMLEANLAKVPSRVLSPAGKARVPERQEQLATFLRQLRQQSGNLRLL